MKNKRLLIAGGGTGGHVLAGVAIADEWKKQFPEGRILFVGSSQGLEVRLVPKAGYALNLLPVGALNKVSFATRLKTLIYLPLCFVKSFWILVLFRPHAVLGVGGYASGPVVLTATFLSKIFRMTTAILEQNSASGFTNRKLGGFVDVIFCAFAKARANFPEKKIRIETGNPIRSNLRRASPPPSSPFTLFIFGGSQGAMGMNTMVLDALPFLKDKGVEIIHQAGVKDFERVKQAYDRIGYKARIESFIDDMASCYEKSSLVICRAGSSSMAELASVGRAALFVPLPTAADNHQEINAQIYEDAGAAMIVRQGSVTGEQFAALILKMRENPVKLNEMIEKVLQFHRPNAAKLIVEELAK